jgi:bifunctional non-homologous end joining protein LigD
VSFVKTSGKTGLHILLPVEPVFTYKQARAMVGHICEQLHEILPDITTIEDETARRGKKVFLDDNQNDLADTIACAYSVRPYHIPTVSMPLTWKQINSKLHPSDFTIETVPAIVKKKGDVMKEFLDSKFNRNNTRLLQKLSKILVDITPFFYNDSDFA